MILQISVGATDYIHLSGFPISFSLSRVFKMPPKTVSQRPTSSAITYAVLAAAAVGFLAVFVFRRIYPQPRRGRDQDDEVENTTGCDILASFFFA